MTRYVGEIYRDQKAEWRWRVRASNGRIVADSGEGYANRIDCAHILAAVTHVEEIVESDET